LLAALGTLLTATLPQSNPTLALLQLTAARAIGGLSLGGLMSQSYALALESSETVRQKTTGMLINVYFGVSVCLLAAWHTISRITGLGWATELAAISGWITLCTLAVAAFAVESPSFLMDAGRTGDAVLALNRVGALNGVGSEAEAAIAAAVGDTSLPAKDRSDPNPGGLWQTEWLLRNACVGVAFFASASAWFALNLSAGALSKDVLLNLVMLTLVDVPCYVLASKLAEKCGTQLAATRLLVAGAIVMVGLSVLGQLSATQAAITLFALAGKGCVSGAFSLLWVLPAEIYPTTCRGAALGFANICGRVGAILAPLMANYLSLPATAASCAGIAVTGAVALTFLD